MQKKKFQIYDPKLKEECAVFGISDNSDASTLTALGLHQGRLGEATNGLGELAVENSALGVGLGLVRLDRLFHRLLHG